MLRYFRAHASLERAGPGRPGRARSTSAGRPRRHANRAQQEEAERARTDYADQAVWSQVQAPPASAAIREDGGISTRTCRPHSPTSTHPNRPRHHRGERSLKGSTHRRCYCRDPKTGKPLGKKCPKLTSRKHGSYSIRQELPPREDGTRRSFSRAGYDTLKAAQADLDHVRALLGLADVRRPRGHWPRSPTCWRRSPTRRLPCPTSRRPGGASTPARTSIGSLTVGEWLDRWLAGKRIRKSRRQPLRDRHPRPPQAPHRPPPPRPAARQPPQRDVHGHRRRQRRDPGAERPTASGRSRSWRPCRGRAWRTGPAARR